MGNINEKLTNIQKDLKAPKGQYNSFGKYKYRSCEDILEAVKPLLAANGCYLTLSDSVEFIGNRFYIRATATISDGENDIRVSAMAREEETKKGMDGSQITGTASSYARKYALNGLFCIDDTKDADSDSYTEQAKKPAKYLCDNCGSLVKEYGGQSPEAIAKATKGKYGRIICMDCINKKKEAMVAMKDGGLPVEVH